MKVKYKIDPVVTGIGTERQSTAYMVYELGRILFIGGWSLVAIRDSMESALATIDAHYLSKIHKAKPTFVTKELA